MKQMNYYFNYEAVCNMCGSSSENHKILGQRLNQSQGYNPKSKIGISTTVMQCKKCHLIFTNPKPIPYNLQDHYGVIPEDYWVPEYFIDDKNYFNYQINIAKGIVQYTEGMKALDVGAGVGKCMVSLINAGFDVYGIEPSLQFFEKAIDNLNIPSDKLKLGMIEEVEYPDNFFDFINFGVVLEHLYNPSEILKKVLKWLKPGGVIHVEVPSSGYMVSKLFNLYFRIRGTNYVTNLSPMHKPFHLYEFALDSFFLHSKQNGYEVVFHEYYVCDIHFIPRFFQAPLKWLMKKTDTGMQLAVWLRKK